MLSPEEKKFLQGKTNHMLLNYTLTVALLYTIILSCH